MLFKKLDLVDYWNKNGLNNIKPMSLRYGEYPEGWNPIQLLSRFIVPLLTDGSIVEIGCGYGRLCRAFDPDVYLGLDINKKAVRLARELNPEYKFQKIELVGHYPPAKLYLAYTVFLHIDDANLMEIIGPITNATDKVIVAEILSKKTWFIRQLLKLSSIFSSHPYFPRNREDYVNLFKVFGFALSEELKKPYNFYRGAEISFLVFERLAPLPMSLSGFPDCLRGGARIEAEGLYDDGWMENKLKLRLRSEGGAQKFNFSALIPHIGEVQGARIVITIDKSNQEIIKELSCGEFHFSKELVIEKGDHMVEIDISPLKQLPDPDGRRVSALLRQVEFVGING